jgi:hypothetical protein
MTIFISHNHNDDLFVDKLRAALRQQGFQIWVDHHDVPVGTIWDHIVEQKLNEAQVLLLILSHSSVSSIKVRAEWYEFQEMGKRVIPIRIDDCRPPLLIRQLQQIDFSKSELFDEQLERLIRELPPVVTKQMEYTEDEIAIRELMSLAIRSNDIIQNQLQEQQIALVFPEIQKQHRVDLKSEKLIIGWHDKETDLKPDVDLTNFGAVTKGVSRQHAMLLKTSNDLMIIDLSSRNGTRINGLPLPIEKPMPLKNKSVLHLADLTMIVFMKE